MFSVCRERNLAVLIVIFFSIKGAAGFFVKHVQTGMCINDTSIKQGNPENWGYLIFLELSDNCLDPAAQFQFRDNSAMLNLKRQSCLIPRSRPNIGHNLDTLYIYVAPAGVDQSCTNNPPVAGSRTITQTSWGGLSISYNAGTWCAVNGHHQKLATEQGIDPYVKLTTPCADVPDQRFNFGSVTCYGDKVENANCPKDQYMVVKNASYRGLSATKTCGLSDDYSCEVNVTCLVKKQCDGQHECTIIVDDKLFSANSCQGFTRYLYFEYQCIDSPTPYLCAPDGPPQNVQVTAESSSSLSVTWEPPEKDKRNGMIVNYTVCISHEESKPCFKEYTTKEQMLVISNLNVSTKYYVRVLASTKVGRGIYSESEGKFTNGKQPDVATNQAQRTLTFTLEIPSKDFTHFYVVALKLKDGKEPTSSDSYENNELVTYAEARKSTNPKPYIAAVVTSSDDDRNMFILGDGRNTSDPVARRRRSTSSDYYNGPLEPGASYSIFQRIFVNKEGEYYSTDWSPASKTIEEKRVGSDSGAEDAGGKYLVAGIIVLAILLVVSFVINAYLIYQNRRLKSSKENPENKDKGRNNSQDIHENPQTVKDDGNYEQVENEQSTYTALNRSGMEENDDHLYTHLNEVGSGYVIQLKTEM